MNSSNPDFTCVVCLPLQRLLSKHAYQRIVIKFKNTFNCCVGSTDLLFVRSSIFLSLSWYNNYK
jgi:hypothetical protein